MLDESQSETAASTGRKQRPPDLEIEQILAWADGQYARTGAWPGQYSGHVIGASREKWGNIDNALRNGHRGLPGGSSLARLLAERRGVRNIQDLPRFTEEKILEWADAYHARTGQWPSPTSGPIEEAPDETWKVVAASLLQGKRGLPGGSSLSQLLAEHRGVRNSHDLPPLFGTQILAWADAHHQWTGDWPSLHSGPITEAPGETWNAVDSALRSGCRGFPGGSSLARLLEECRGVPNPASRPPLTVGQILAWADAHRVRTGRWPNRDSGPVEGAAGERWSAVDTCLLQGNRGLSGGCSLSGLLAAHRGAPSGARAVSLAEEQILAWADAHRARTGQWPTQNSGPIPEAPGETWKAVQMALLLGYRGFPGGNSLARLLAEHRGVRNSQALSPLTEELILAWADAHHKSTGKWPSASSGPIEHGPSPCGTPPGETWASIEHALRSGRRGLPGRSSLAQLLAARRQVRNPLALPGLTVEQVLAWADAHHAQTGEWPTRCSGPVVGAEGESWAVVDSYLMQGKRDLPGGSTLARFLAEQHGVRSRSALPALTVEKILAWADSYFARHQRWPHAGSGPVEAAPEETWCGIQHALQRGKRGLPEGSSLRRLFAEHRGARHHQALPELTEGQILAWADAYHTRHGAWPQVRLGAIEGAAGETWLGIDTALRQGHRGLPGGSSLRRLISDCRPS